MQALQTTVAALVAGVAVAEQLKELQTAVRALTGRSNSESRGLEQAESELLEKGTVLTLA